MSMGKIKYYVLLVATCFCLIFTSSSVTANAATKTTTKVSTTTKYKNSKITQKKKAKKTKTTKSKKTTTKKKTKKYSTKTVVTTTKTTTTTWKYYKKGKKQVKVKKRIVTRVTTKTTQKVEEKKTVTTSQVPNLSLSSLMNGVDSRVKTLWNKTGFKVYLKTGAPWTGMTNISDRAIYLSRNDRSVFLHELGHFVWYFTALDGKTNTLNSYYKAEKGKYTKYNKTYVTSSASEFFAECFKLYHTEPSYLKRTCPKMYNLVMTCLNNICSDAELKKVLPFLK